MAEKTQANPDKLKVLNAVMEKIEKDFGKGSIMRMSSAEVADVQVIPTGSITLDMALGVGGYPKGRVIEIYGPESSGKTTLAIHAIAEAQKTGGIAAFIDAEHAFDSSYAQQLGVDVDNLLISQPDNGEQALEIADSLIRSSAIDIIFGEGISKIGEIIDLGVDYGVIKKSGSWFSYGDRKLGQGRDAVKELFKTDTALADEIETKVREAMKAPQQK